jgi:hypothetical protein
MTILDAVRDASLFAPFFKNPASWQAWFAVLAAIFALPMTKEQVVIYQQLTGRTEPPTEVAKEVWLCVGRRGGKSRIISLIAVWLACFHDYRKYLAPGEKGTVQVIAADRKQARTVMRYVKAFITNVPMLDEMVERSTAESVTLNNHTIIEVSTASFRSVRGFTAVACLLDEIAYLRTDDESCNPDTEIVAAIRPAMATIPNAMLLASSSPYSRRGTLFEAHRDHYGKDHDRVLVVQADTGKVNPAVDQKIVAAAYEDDPARAAAEYGGQFRVDVEGFVTREVVEACIARGCFERSPRPGLKYAAFCDPSGGSSDSFSLAIGFRDGDSLILAAIREVRPPFSPESAVMEFAGLIKSYKITRVVGDKYASLWPVEVFARHGIRYEQSAKPKSDLYQSLLPLLNSQCVSLLDNQRLVSQLVNLERITARSGKDSVDRGSGGHDDELCRGCSYIDRSTDTADESFRRWRFHLL